MKLTLKEIILTGLFTAFTAVVAQLSINIPPVPITLSLFGVFLSAAILGSKCGALSQIVYILLGIVGVPVFQGFQGGINVLGSARGGYIISYPIMAYLIGYFMEHKKNISRINMAGVMAAGLAICYIIGASWLSFVLGVSILKAAAVGVIPFIPLDLLKVFLSAFIGYQVRMLLLKANLL